VLTSRVDTALPFGRAIQVGPIVLVLAAAMMGNALVFPTSNARSAVLRAVGAGPMVWTITSTTLRQSLQPVTCWAVPRRCF